MDLEHDFSLDLEAAEALFAPGWPALTLEAPAAEASVPAKESAPPQTGVAARRGPRGGKKPMRSRQRAIAALEAELARKLQVFQSAQAEKTRLEQRIKVLEVVLPMREQQVQLLKQRQQSPPFVKRSTVLRITELATTSDTSSSNSDEGLARSLPEVASAPDLEATARGGSPDAALPSYTDAICFSPATSSVPCGVFGTPTHVIQQFMTLWNKWVREAGLLLHAHDAQPCDPGPQLKLAALREQLSPALRAMRVEYPQLPMDVVDLNMETGERGEPANTNWVAIVQALRLSPEQVADCRAAVALYRERLEAVASERQALTSQVAACLEAYRRRQQQHEQHQKQQNQKQQRRWQEPHTGRQPAGRAPAGAQQGGRERSGQQQQQQQLAVPSSCGLLLLELLDKSAQLRRNVLAEGQVVECVKDFLGSCMFSLVQLVRASVLCYPFFPDAVAILTTVAETAPPPPAATVVTAAAVTAADVTAIALARQS